jgi:hypothetical protein
MPGFPGTHPLIRADVLHLMAGLAVTGIVSEAAALEEARDPLLIAFDASRDGLCVRPGTN